MADAQPARILVVDDETAQMKALCNTLRADGHETTGYSSPRDALAAFDTQPFDLLLTDLMMPEMDGIALLRAAQERDPDLVGIMMTGHGTLDSAVEAMKSGALDYILKPFKLSVIRPVLARALAVRQLRRDNVALARRVAERTAELEAANQELESFSHSVAHDLRAPLRAVNGYAEIVLADYAPQLPAEVQSLLRRISTGAQLMGQLVDDLLRLSRLGRQPLSRASISMSALVRDVLEEMEKSSDRPSQILVGELPDAFGDRALLRQVLLNLLSNAFKFSRGREGAIVEIGYLRQPEAGYFIRDNGAGFDMAFAGKLFEVFQRLHGVHEFEGTGIGLSIVQRVIQRHGGRIWAEGEVGKGATFYFTLPQRGDRPESGDRPVR